MLMVFQFIEFIENNPEIVKLIQNIYLRIFDEMHDEQHDFKNNIINWILKRKKKKVQCNDNINKTICKHNLSFKIVHIFICKLNMTRS